MLETGKHQLTSHPQSCTFIKKVIDNSDEDLVVKNLVNLMALISVSFGLLGFWAFAAVSRRVLRGFHKGR